MANTANSGGIRYGFLIVRCCIHMHYENLKNPGIMFDVAAQARQYSGNRSLPYSAVADILSKYLGKDVPYG